MKKTPSKIFNGLKRIENEGELIDWAFIVNGGLTTSQICDAQDIYARSEQQVLDRLWIDLDTYHRGDRGLVISSVYNAMGYDEVERLLKLRAKNMAMKIIEKEMDDVNQIYNDNAVKIQKKEAELERKIETFDTCKKAVYKKLARMRERLEYQEKTLNLLRTEQKEILGLNRQYKDIAAVYEKKARLFDKIKEALGVDTPPTESTHLRLLGRKQS